MRKMKDSRGSKSLTENSLMGVEPRSYLNLALLKRGYISFPYRNEGGKDGYSFIVIGTFVYYPLLPLDYRRALSILFTVESSK